jgi:uncharacterized membrane protein YhhN
MKDQPAYLLSLYFVVAILHLVFIYFSNEYGIIATKPMLMAILALWFYLITKTSKKLPVNYFLSGIIFSMFGDILLMFKGEDFFLFGLFSFLIAHIFYIIWFVKYPGFKEGALAQKPIKSIPFLIYLIAITSILWKNLGEMKMPVIVYSAVITFMAICAANMKNRANTEAYIPIVGGAILFVISDSIIAISKFNSTDLSETATRIMIMSSYIAGQYLLAKGSYKAAARLSNSTSIVGPPK